jgi:hypothetical protein
VEQSLAEHDTRNARQSISATGEMRSTPVSLSAGSKLPFSPDTIRWRRAAIVRLLYE